MLDSTTVRVVSMLENPHTAAPTADTSFLSREATAPARRLHRSMTGYAPTPLVELSGLAKRGGVRSVLVKDESPRFGLNAFKALGGLYALFRVVCRELGLDYRTATMDTLKSPEYRDRVSRMEFITTTDGNHGRGVSWAAGMLGCRAHVFMPRGSVEVRAQAIREVGNADVTITDLTYDDAVRYSAKLAEENGWFWYRIPRGPAMKMSPHGSYRATPPCSLKRWTSSGIKAMTVPPMCFCRPVSALWPVVCWVRCKVCTALRCPASPLWSRTMWPAFTSLSSSRTVRHILPPGTI